MTRSSDFAPLQPALGAALGSAAILGGAFIFQALGYAPCPMCIWQRWPHGIAIALGVIFALTRLRGVALLGALVMLVSAGLGGFHAGVEQGFWPGPSSCTGASDALAGLSGASLLPSAGAAPSIVMCDEIVWDTWGLGITMAAWNFVFSLVFAGLWLVAFKKS